MKSKKIILIFAILVCAFVMCSFKNFNANNENKSYQKGIKRHVNSLESSWQSLGDSSFGFIEDEYEIGDTLNYIYEEFLKILPSDIDFVSQDFSEGISTGAVFDYIASSLTKSGAMKNLSVFIAMAIMLALSETVSSDMAEISPFVKAASSICFALPVLNMMKDVLFTVESAMISGSDFFGKLIPLLSTVTAVSMKSNTALVSSVTMNAALSFISSVLLENLIEMGTLIFVLSLIASFDTGQGISSVSRGIRGWFSFLIGLSSFIFVTVLAFQNLIVSSKDTVILRSAKYAISGMIPIVGSTVSGALATLISGIKYLSVSIGAVSVLVILSVMGAPLITLLFYRLCMGACITLTSFSGASYAERFFNSIRGALDTVIAVLASSVMVYVLQIIVFMKSFEGAF